MTARLLKLSVLFLTVGLSATASAAEFSDGTIVISDNWCNPNNDGACLNCNAGRLINRALCNNSFCDNMVYGCYTLTSVAGSSSYLSGPIFTANSGDSSKCFGKESDESNLCGTNTGGASSMNAVCPVGYAMVGMHSTGNYSDNIWTHCQQIVRAAGWSDHMYIAQQWSSYFSDDSNHSWFMAPGDGVAMGASCSGSNCDNMYFWYLTY